MIKEMRYWKWQLLLLAGFALRFFLPGIRKGWCKAGLIALTGIYTFLFLLNILSECTFWYEFGVRYNFIAVDYLVYTNEVIGNIFESYPILPMFLGILVATLLVWRPLFGRHDLSEAGNGGALNAGVRLIVYAFLFAASVGWLHFSYRNLQSRNTFATELQCNGCWNFLEAYSSSTLEYDRFYEMLPEEEVRAQKLALCAQRPDGTQLRPALRHGEPVRPRAGSPHALYPAECRRKPHQAARQRGPLLDRESPPPGRLPDGVHLRRRQLLRQHADLLRGQRL